MGFSFMASQHQTSTTGLTLLSYHTSPGHTTPQTWVAIQERQNYSLMTAVQFQWRRTCLQMATLLQLNSNDHVIPLCGTRLTSNSEVFNHIYQYFSSLLNCSLQGGADFPSYQGRTSMYEVHRYGPYSPLHSPPRRISLTPPRRFMDLDTFQNTYFINLVVTSLTSLGVSPSDSALIGSSLTQKFNTRCAAPISVPNIAAPPELQSICIAPNCPLDPNSNCSAYPLDGVALAPVNVTTNVTVGSSGSGTVTNSTTSGAPLPVQTSVGAVFGLNMGMVFVLVAAMGVSFLIGDSGL